MKKTYKKCSALLMASVMLMLTGCGEEPINLTDEERNEIVTYAAHIVGKYNGAQTEGLVYIAEEADDTKSDDDSEKENTTEPPQNEEIQDDESTQENLENEEEQDVLGPEEKVDDEKPSTDLDTVGTGQQDDEKDLVSFNEALGLGDVAAEYKGFDVLNPYVEADYYSVTAEPGKTYLVLKVDLTNNAAEAMNCNILAAGPVFTATINGNLKVNAETTILLNDLSTFSTDMEVGETVPTVLLFQIPEEDAANIAEIGLKVFINNTNYEIAL